MFNSKSFKLLFIKYSFQNFTVLVSKKRVLGLKVFEIGLQKYRDYLTRVFGKDLIPLVNRAILLNEQKSRKMNDDSANIE